MRPCQGPVIQPVDTLDDAIEVGGRIIHNADDGMMASGHANETLDDIVTYSHNVGAAEVALRVRAINLSAFGTRWPRLLKMWRSTTNTSDRR